MKRRGKDIPPIMKELKKAETSTDTKKLDDTVFSEIETEAFLRLDREQRWRAIQKLAGNSLPERSPKEGPKRSAG